VYCPQASRAVNAFVAVTDNEWFRYLSSLPEVDEVNFWQPSGGRAFRVLQPGEPLLFKLHAPLNYIVGGGFFVKWSSLPCSLAWEAFGPKNGTPSLEVMRARIEYYRRIRPSPLDYEIGCTVLAQPFFFPRDEWIDAPADFHRNIVVGKTYSLSPPGGTWLWEAVQSRLLAMAPPSEDPVVEMFGDPVPVRPRLGQGSFRVLVTDTYQRHCAITGEKILPVLQAAHIKPVSAGGFHDIRNGLLLRSDIHTLFDRGYVTVAPDHRVRVSRSLRNDWHNGESYLQLNGQDVWVPASQADRPRSDFLEWHADTIFRG
jgi:putative restriction endonuclease